MGCRAAHAARRCPRSPWPTPVPVPRPQGRDGPRHRYRDEVPRPQGRVDPAGAILGSGPGPGGGHPASPGSGGGEATRPQDEEPTNLEWILEPFAYEEMLAIWPTIVSSWRGLAAQRVRRPPLPACACPCSRACACPPARLPACPPARLPTCRFSRQPVSPPGGAWGEAWWGAPQLTDGQ